MAFRTPLQHLLRGLLPPGNPPQAPAGPDFEDTRPDERPAASRRETRRAAEKTPPAQRRQPTAWAESSIELAQGTEIVEFPDDTAADLMDEYFAKANKRAA